MESAFGSRTTETAVIVSHANTPRIATPIIIHRIVIRKRGNRISIESVKSVAVKCHAESRLYIS